MRTSLGEFFRTLPLGLFQPDAFLRSTLDHELHQKVDLAHARDSPLYCSRIIRGRSTRDDLVDYRSICNTRTFHRRSLPGSVELPQRFRPALLA